MNRKSGRDDAYICTVPKDLGFAGNKLFIRRSDHRHRLARQSHVNRPIDLIRIFNELFCLRIIARAEDRHIRKRPHQRKIFDALVRTAVAGRGDTAVRAGNFDVRLGIAHAVADDLKCTPCRKHRKGTGEGYQSCSGQTGRHTDHILLCDTGVEKTFGKFIQKSRGTSCMRQICIECNDVFMRSGKLGQSFAISLPCRFLISHCFNPPILPAPVSAALPKGPCRASRPDFP